MKIEAIYVIMETNVWYGISLFVKYQDGLT